MLRTRIAAFGLALLACGPALAQTKQTYLCVEDQNVGFKAANGRYAQVAFVLRRFVLQVTGTLFEIKYTGSSSVDDSFTCTQPFTTPNARYAWQCGGEFAAFTFNTKTMNFSYASMYGWVSERELAGKDSTTISVGTCVVF